MSTECRNDCIEAILFPKTIYNRPGLAHIDYRIGTYSDFRQALLRSLNLNTTLANWTHREADDPGIALLEGAAILGDILTFYQELYANEAFLRTAQWRESVSDLVRLLGYRFSPGLGGSGTFAFEVKGDNPVTIPAGFPLKAEVEGADKPVDFETSEESLAIPELSSFSLYRPTIIPALSGDVSVFSIETAALLQAGTKLNEKDRLMLLDTDLQATNNSQIVIVKEIEEEFDRTNITIEGTWHKGSGASEIFAYQLGRTFRHFGHTAPPEVVKLVSGSSSLQSITYRRKLHFSTTTTNDTKITPSIVPTQLPLDSQVDDLVVGSKLIIEQLAFHEATIVRTIQSFRPASMTWGALSGATTIVTIDSEMDDLRFGHEHSSTDVRKLVIHETVNQKFMLTRNREIDLTSASRRLYFFGNFAGYRDLDNRRLAFQKEDGTFVEKVAIAEETNPDVEETKKLRPVLLDSPLNGDFTLDDFPLQEPKVSVYGNLASATQGKTEKEAVLGNGDNRQIFQTFKLPKAPLTYLCSPEHTPPEVPELQIYVNERLWEQEPSFFGRKPDEEIYIVREDVESNSWVQFGDGKTGARLPSGIKNVKAVYRTGIGAFGAKVVDTKVQAVGKLKQLDKIELPGVVSGGSEAESGENAREAAPGKVQSLDRLVSIKDFEIEALAISGVIKASAAWGLFEEIPSVLITVLMESERAAEVEAVEEVLRVANRCRGAQRFPLHVISGDFKYIYVNVTYGYDATFRRELLDEAVKEALGATDGEGNGIDGASGLFGIKNRRFGEAEYATRVEGTVQNVEGVVWARVTALGSLGVGGDPSALDTASITKVLNPAVQCELHIVLSLYASHLQLHASVVEGGEVC